MLYIIHLLILVAIFATMAKGLDVLAGHCGQLSVAQTAFYGIGAYTSALSSINLGCSFSVSLALAIFVSGGSAFVVGAILVRLREEHFTVATLAFQIFIFSLLNNAVSVTHGPMGVAGISRPDFFGRTIDSALGYLFISLCALGCVTIITHRLTVSPFGRVLRAIRENPLLVEALGKDVNYFKIWAFVISSVTAGLSGVLYAHYVTFIDPTSFTLMESVFVLSMVILGGAATAWGPVVGAGILILLPELLRFIGIPSSFAANIREIVYGVLLVLMLMFFPRGFVRGSCQLR